MQELLMCLFVNRFLFLATAFAVYFHAQLKRIWRASVNFICFTWRTVFNLTFAAFYGGISVLSAAGINGSMFISEYASITFLPVLCVMLLIFASIVVGILLNQFIDNGVEIKRTVSIKEKIVFFINASVEYFKRPSMVLLQ